MHGIAHEKDKCQGCTLKTESGPTRLEPHQGGVTVRLSRRERRRVDPGVELERGVVRAVVVVGFDLVPEVESRQFIAICFGAYLRRAVAEYQSIKFDG